MGNKRKMAQVIPFFLKLLGGSGEMCRVLMKKEHLKSQIIITKIIINQIYNGKKRRYTKYKYTKIY